MGSEKTFKHESVEDITTITKYLKQFVEGMEKGHLTFTSKNNDVDLEPRGLINFDVMAKKKNGRQKLTLKFAWKEVDAPEPDNESLVIETK